MASFINFGWHDTKIWIEIMQLNVRYADRGVSNPFVRGYLIVARFAHDVDSMGRFIAKFPVPPLDASSQRRHDVPNKRCAFPAGLQHSFVLVGIDDGLHDPLPDALDRGRREMPDCSGLVTFIAAYHYMCIFNSWTEADAYSRGLDSLPVGPHPTGVRF